MRTFIILLALTFTSHFFAQNFAPVGAKWYYTRHYMSSGDQNYYLIEVIKDTIINNKTCSVLKNMNDKPS